MQFKQTYRIYETGYQREKYYYIDNKRVSADTFYETSYICQRKGMQYNTSYLRTKSNGRVESVYYLD